MAIDGRFRASAFEFLTSEPYRNGAAARYRNPFLTGQEWSPLCCAGKVIDDDEDAFSTGFQLRKEI